jgi:hypothetical protein
VGDWWSCRWSPVASQGAPPAAVRETHKAILWGGGDGRSHRGGAYRAQVVERG